MSRNNKDTPEDLFLSAEWYDRSINWSARLERELPVLIDLFGPPGAGGIVDAGCGTGRQACALAQHGYRVVGADAGEEMLEVARQHARKADVAVDFVHTTYATMQDRIGGGFDGIFCLGNALSAAGTAGGVAEAIEQFARCLRPGGRFFVQILNFAPMRSEQPCVRGPRVSCVDGREYVSVREFHFGPDTVRITNITLFNDSGWKKRVHGGSLYPISVDELVAWCRASGIRIDHTWGSYARDPFDIDASTDLIVAGTRVHAKQVCEEPLA